MYLTLLYPDNDALWYIVHHYKYLNYYVTLLYAYNDDSGYCIGYYEIL